MSHWVRITGVYGTTYREEKALFGDWMKTHFSPSTVLWLCGGDFNEFIWDHEKSGGAVVLYNQPQYLANFLHSGELLDLDFNEPSFTWRGNRHGEWVEERLNRGLINQFWYESWPNTTVTHNTVLGSDHCPIIIQCNPRRLAGQKLFRFETFWAKEEECKRLVQTCWERPCHGHALDRWQKRINDCWSWLINWSRRKFKKKGMEIEELLSQLGEL